MEVVREHEIFHIDYLTTILGEDATSRPSFGFGSTLNSPERFATTAVVLEDLGVAAYSGQATSLTAERGRELPC